jgi:hypothetical protein
MTYARLLVALLVVLALIPGQAAAQEVSGGPDLDATLGDNRVVPGAETTLTVSLVNEGRITTGSTRNPQLTSRVTTARGVTAELAADGAPFEVQTATRGVGSVPEGTAPVNFAIAVDEDADPGTYDVPVTVSYSYTSEIDDDGDETIRSRTRTFDVPVVVEDDARLSVVNVSTQAAVGSTDTVAVAVENTGSATAGDASLTLESANAALTFEGASRAVRALGDWAPGETRTVEYEATVAASAKPQPYAVDVTANYENDDGTPQSSATRTLTVTPRAQQTFAVEATESTVAVGDTGTVTVRMRNDGPRNVSDATVELSATSANLAFSGSASASRFVGTWAPGETKTLTYDLTATDDAETRSYALQASVSYEDSEGDAATAPAKSLGVTPEPEQSFAVGEVTSNLAVGEEGTLEGTVTNTGEAPVDSAVVVFETQKATVTPIETEYPVGDLSAGASAAFSFPIEISGSAEAGPQQFAVSVQYRNQNDDLRGSDSFDVRQEVAPEAPEFALETTGASAAPGGSTQINVTVTNDGDETFTDISATVFADSPISVTDDEAFIDSLEPGESETVQFGLGVGGGALPKTYPISMDFQYDDSDGDRLVSDTYREPVTVVEPDDDGGDLPVVLIGVAALVLVVAVYAYRRYY